MRATKISLGVTVLILVIGGTIALQRQRKLSEVSEEKEQLVERATELGIEVPTADAAAVKPKRQRDPSGDKTRSAAARMVAFARELDRQQETGDENDEEFEKRGLELQASLMELDAAQLKLVIAALREADGLADETRTNMMCVVIAMLGEREPAAALAMFAESGEMLANTPAGAAVVSATLEKWAENDPLAALEWMRKNSALHPALTDDDARRNLVVGAAQNDPKLAFQLIGELGVEDADAAVGAIIDAAITPAQRTAVLDGLRGYVDTLPQDERADALRDSLESIGRGISNESFDAVQSWISEAKLTPDETSAFVGGLSYQNTAADTGRWIDWMTTQLPETQLTENVENLVGQWTQQDYLAAGAWLTNVPNGPAKEAAVSSYATTVAEYEPQTAVQWALTLPPGDRKDATLESIYQNWPKDDFAAATQFAKEHGIQTEPDPEPPTEEP